jgi:high-affinity Fe2+/Pb2+ permease
LRLVRGSWWHTATILGVAGGVVMALYVVGILVGLLFAQVEGRIDRSAATLMLGIVSGLLAAMFQPLFVALGVVQYLDLRRREASRTASSAPSPTDPSGIGSAAPAAPAA